MKKKINLLCIFIPITGIYRIFLAKAAFYDPEEMYWISASQAKTFSEFLKTAKTGMAGFLDMFLLRAISLLNTNEMFIRICEVCLSLIALFIIYKVTLKITKDEDISCLTVVLTALSPLTNYYSIIVRYHNLEIIMFALSISYFFDIYEGKARKYSYVLYGLFTSLSIMTHYYAFYLIAAQMFLMVFRRIDFLSYLKRAFVMGLSIILFFLPWIQILIYQLMNRPGMRLMKFDIITNRMAPMKLVDLIDTGFGMLLGDYFKYHENTYIARMMFFSSMCIFLIMVGLFCFRLVMERRNNSSLKMTIYLLMISILLSYFIQDIIGMAATVKYLLPFVFMVFLIFSILIYSLNNNRLRKTFTAILMIFLISNDIYMLKIFNEKPNIKDTFEKITSSASRNDVFAISNIVSTNCGTLFEKYKSYKKVNSYQINNLRDLEGIKKRILKDNENVGSGKKYLIICNAGNDISSYFKSENIGSDEAILKGYFASSFDNEKIMEYKISPRAGYYKGIVLEYD